MARRSGNVKVKSFGGGVLILGAMLILCALVILVTNGDMAHLFGTIESVIGIHP